ncbi:hypothetical protein CROQUDRAFT_102452 [Cronartium quercuum f. sp. fusiforme G11]|uniref:Uncharacterized protein n=1 Tax=Cronartium quercuum f. sp. fusiforme G11 TaxID=708437 RepID=A0A9P6N5K5_9BASI|nr:hypothetical protein CROQUDRAFT_102452 [Cronartium quercuum f. sp. fusiforme G11]
MAAKSENTAIFEALVNDFHTKASIKDVEPDETSSDLGSNYITGPDDPNVYKLVYLIMYFISWLFLECRISRDNCRKARDYVVRITRLCMQINLNNDWASSVPKDVQTITNHLNLEATLERYVCCTKCYTLYEPEAAPAECGYQELPTTEAHHTRISIHHSAF